MLDQNITTILTALITVLGTLGGTVVGVVLTNHHAAKLETLKIKQDKSKRNIEIIEEIYSLLIKIQNCSKTVLSNKKFIRRELGDEIDRVTMLVRLYLPSVIPLLNEWLDINRDLELEITFTPDIEKLSAKEKRERIDLHTKYYHALRTISNALENLVR
jgi:hypothetical protein